MDNKQVFHIAGEIIVVGCISLYFINQIKKLNEEIAGLKDELKSQKEITNRNFNQIYAILNSAFNIPVMPTPGSQGSGEISRQKEVQQTEINSLEHKTNEKKSIVSQKQDEYEPEEVKSKENFSHLTPLGSVSRPPIMTTRMSIPIPMGMGMSMGMPIDGIIVGQSFINMEEVGPRKRNVASKGNVRNMDVEITEVIRDEVPVENRPESHLMIEDEDDINEDITDKEIEKELKSLGIYTSDGTQETGTDDISNQKTQENNIEEAGDQDLTMSSQDMNEPEIKTIKTTKRKKNLKNSS